MGATWEVLDGALPRPYRPVARSMACDEEAPDTLFAGMNDGTVWQSDDAGEHFHQVASGLPEVTSIKVIHR
jgi:hypothetical protein